MVNVNWGKSKECYKLVKRINNLVCFTKMHLVNKQAYIYLFTQFKWTKYLNIFPNFFNKNLTEKFNPYVGELGKHSEDCIFSRTYVFIGKFIRSCIGKINLTFYNYKKIQYFCKLKEIIPMYTTTMHTYNLGYLTSLFLKPKL